MKTFYLPNMSATDMQPMPLPPWKATIDPYPVKTKDEYEKWIRDKETDHCFYSAIEGVNPHRRVSLENPAKWMHGLVADYDAKLPDDFDLKELLGRCNPDALPRAISRTFSGNARVVWEFAKPILVDCPEFSKAIFKEIARKFKLAKILPGLDECTFRTNQLYEIGHDWLEVPGKPVVSEDVCGDLLVEAGSKVNWNKVGETDTEIPIEKIAAEIEVRWPGRWPGEFKIGARGPTFWIEDGVDRVGCQVGDHGMVCYTDRAGKSFVSWGELLGNAFVDKFREEVIGKAVMEFFYDGRAYWRKNGQERWYDFKVEDVSRKLRVNGIKTDSKKGASQLDRVIDTIQTHQRVDAAVPILFTEDEIVDIGNDRFLNTNFRKPVVPASDGSEALWPYLKNWIWPVFGEEQLPYFLAWFARFYKGAIESEPTQGQVVVVAGGPSQGKTLLNWRVVGAAMGGFADATPYLQGKTSFNKTAAEHPVWSIDDPTGQIDYDKHKMFGEAIKAHVANPRVSYHPKHKDSIEIPWYGRLFMTCNTDPQSLAVLPPMDNAVADKIMLFKFTDYQHQFGRNSDVEGVIAAELPHFLRWLLEYSPPAHVTWDENKRFGVRPYHHPEMLHTAVEDNPATKLNELVDRWAASMRRDDKTATEWKGTATDLYTSLMGIDEGNLKPLMSRYTAVRLGRELRTLAQRGGTRVIKYTNKANVSRYVINLEDRDFHK
jgi:hypothetical protein